MIKKESRKKPTVDRNAVYKRIRQSGVSGAIVLGAVCLALTMPLSASPAYAQMDNYTYYYNQAIEAYNAGQMTKAIESFEKSLPFASDISLGPVYNNIAATYISRAKYHLEKGDAQSAANDFRLSSFYIDYGWPEGVTQNQVHRQNKQTAQDNLKDFYRRMKIDPRDKKTHMELAKNLRLKGDFKAAIVEYGEVLKIDPKDTEAQKAMGDLFNVLNLPEKSAKYYQEAATTSSGGKGSDDIYVNLGTASYKNNDIDNAVIQFNKALEINPHNMAALNQLERIWHNEIKFNPTSVLGHANLASVLQKKKMYDQAMDQYKAAEHFANVRPGTSFDVKKLIRLNIGTLFQEKKDFRMALSAYDSVLAMDPQNKLAIYYKATLFKETGNVPGAIEGFNKVLAIEPGNEEAQKELFELITQHPDKNQMRADLKAYGDKYSSNALVQNRVGEIFHENKDYQNALYFYQRALALDSQQASTHANIGAVLQAMGREEDSLQAYRQAQELDPSNDTVNDLLASAQQNVGYNNFQKAVELQQQGQHREALTYLEKALESNPDSPEMIAAYGVSLQNLNELNKAIDQYQKAITKDSQNANYHYYLATAFHQKNDLGKARLEYEKALSLDSTLASAREALDSLAQAEASNSLNDAVEAFNKKQYPKAMSLIDKTLSHNGDNSIAHYYKGLIQEAQNNKTGAIVSYKAAVRYDPNFSDAYYAMALLMDEKNDKVGAKSAFQKFVQLAETEDDFVRYAKERLESL